MNGIERAQRLMELTTSKEFDKYVNENRDNLGNTSFHSYSKSISSAPLSVHKGMKNNGLPQQIYESFMENPLNYEEETNASLNALFSQGKFKNLMTKKNDAERSNLNEEVNVEKTPYQNENKASIDYSLIKMIVESVFNEKMSEISSKLLTEGKNNTQTLSTVQIRNNKLNVLTANGDLYEADLKFIKNVNNKK